MKKSKINKRWIEELEKYSDEITVHELYKAAPNWEFNVEEGTKAVSRTRPIYISISAILVQLTTIIKKMV